MNKQTARLLEQHFDTAFAAPDGIARLRELILTLAMQGRLVEQDPSYPPASELLKEAQAEKQQLVKAGKIKKSKPLPPIKPEEMPYELPKGWEWVRLDSLVSKVGSGSTPRGGKSAYVQDGIPFLRSQNVWNDGLKLDDVAYITHEINDKMSATQVFPKDILLNITGASLGRCALVTDLFQTANVSQHVTIVRCIKEDQRHYLHYLFLSPYCQNMIWSRQVGMAREGLSKKVLEQFEIPLPPLPEQHRIVARIDQLMARCDELKTLRKEREEKRLAIHAAAINQLLDAPDGSAWNFIQQHFGKLYTVKENVAELRKAILQLAVMGRLVPQNSDDPPASELLKEIKAEKQRLVKAGKIKKSKPFPPIKPEEVPFKLPLGWEWVLLGDLCPEYQNGISKRRSNAGIETIVLRLSDIIDNGVSLENIRKIQLSENEIKKYLLSDSDILITRVNGSIDLVGSFILVRHPQKPFVYCDHFIRMRLQLKYIDVDFLHRISKSLLIRRQIEGKFVTTAGQKTVNQTHITTLTLPLPPLPEQHRIVAKIDQLMALCDTLEQQIDDSTVKQTEILNAVMARVGG